ncbi:MAG: hypothetical protein IKP47_05285 [Ruminococcus sp.]|nr:hypothetical protein [Ruminococcus sp.]
MFFKKKEKGTPRSELEKLHGKRLSYVSERDGNGERVIGRKGGISVTESELIIVCDGKEVFRCLLDGCIAAELMSRNGVDIKADDGNGKRRHVTAYYSVLRQ